MKRIEEEITRLKEIRALVAQMLEDGDIGTFGVANNNGADSYQCPACYESTNIYGHCSTRETLDQVKNHAPDCTAIKLQELIKLTEPCNEN